MFVQSHIQRVHRQSHNHQHSARSNQNQHLHNHHNHHHQLVASATNRSSPALGLDRSQRGKSTPATNKSIQCHGRQESEKRIRSCLQSDRVTETDQALGANLGTGAVREVRAKLNRNQKLRASIKLPGSCRSQTRARLVTKTSDTRIRLKWHSSAIKIGALVRLLRESDLLHISKLTSVSGDRSDEKSQPLARKFIEWFKLSTGNLFSESYQPVGPALRQTLDLFVLYLGSFIEVQWETLCQLFMGEPKFVDGPDCSRSQFWQYRQNWATNQRRVPELGHETSFVRHLRFSSLDESNENSNQSHVAWGAKRDRSQRCHEMGDSSSYGLQVDHPRNRPQIPTREHTAKASVDQTSRSAIGRHCYGGPEAPSWLTASDDTTMHLLPDLPPFARPNMNYNQDHNHRMASTMPTSYLDSGTVQQDFQQGIRADLLHGEAPVDTPTDHLFWRWHTIDGCAPYPRPAGSHRSATLDKDAPDLLFQPAVTHSRLASHQNRQQESRITDPRLNDGGPSEPNCNPYQQPMRPIRPAFLHHKHHHNHQRSIQAVHQRGNAHFHGRPVSWGLPQCHSQQSSTQQQQWRPQGPPHHNQFSSFSILRRDKFERQLSSIIGSDNENCPRLSDRPSLFNSSPSLSSTSSISSGFYGARLVHQETTNHGSHPPPSPVGARHMRHAIHPLEGRRLQRQASSTASDASFSSYSHLNPVNQLAGALKKMSLEQNRQPTRTNGPSDSAAPSIDPRGTQSANGRISVRSIKSKSYSPTSSTLVDSGRTQRAYTAQSVTQITSSVENGDRKSELQVKNNSKIVSQSPSGKSKALVHSSLGVTATTLGKVSLAGARRRLGFKRNRGLNSLSVHRSEEIFPSDLGASLLAHQHSSTTTTPGLYSLNDSYDQDSNQSSSTPREHRAKWLSRFSYDSPNSKVCFVEGLGQGQIVSRQALVSPYLGDIQLSLSDRRGMLEVEVIRVRQLQPKANAKRMPAISVKVYLMKDKKCLAKVKTAQVSHTLSPMFQQSFIFRADYKDCVLQIIVWGDYGKSDRKSLMGIVQIHLNQVDISDMVIGWYKLFNAQSMVVNQSMASSSKSLRQTLSTTKLTDLEQIESNQRVGK